MKSISMAPLIHSRTYSVDFRPNFFAIPQDFDKDKIEWAKKFVLSSTKELEFTRNEIRKLIFSDGEHCIVGITCHVSTLSKICGETIEETRDSTGTREVYVFLGLTYKIDNNSEGLVFDISPSTFLDIYKKYVIPKWLDKVASEPFPLSYSNYSVQESKNPFNPDTFDVKETSSGTRKALESNIDSDEQLYKYTLSKVKIGQEVSMCTKLSNLNSFAKSPFESATCLNISGSLKDILENQQPKEETKFKADNSSGKRSSNTDNHGTEIRKVTDLGQIARVTVIIGGIAYLIIVPTKSLPLSILAGTCVIVSAGYEFVKRKKDKNNYSSTRAQGYQGNNSFSKNSDIKKKAPQFNVRSDDSKSVNEKDNRDDIFKI